MVAGLCSSNHCPPTVVLQWTEFIIIIIPIIIPITLMCRLTVDPVQVSRPGLSCSAMWNLVWESRWDEGITFCICICQFDFVYLCIIQYLPCNVKSCESQGKMRESNFDQFFHWGSYQRGPSPILISVPRPHRLQLSADAKSFACTKNENHHRPL